MTVMARPHLVVDAHVHVYPVKSWGLRRTHDHAIDEYGRAEVAYPTGDGGNLQDAVAAARAAEADYVVLLNLFEPNRWRRDIKDLGHDAPAGLREVRTAAEYLLALNRWLCSTAAREEGVLPVIAIDASCLAPQELADHVEECVREHGAAGVKLHPNRQGVAAADRRLHPVWDVCSSLGIPAVVHSGPASGGWQPALPSAFRPLLQAYPSLTVVLAHLGGAAWREAAEVARCYPRALFDCSEIICWLGAPAAPTPSEFVALLRQVGMDRVLLGSDYPWYAPAEALARLGSLPGLLPDEFEQVAGANAARVFGAGLRRSSSKPTRQGG